MWRRLSGSDKPGVPEPGGNRGCQRRCVKGYNAVSFVGYNFHSMALTLVFWFAILSGWGMKHESDEELAADGIVIEDGNSGK